jgi:hypothetical protein
LGGSGNIKTNAGKPLISRYHYRTLCMNKVYDVLLGNIKIGTTELEDADVSMGVVFGRINFVDITSGYGFFRTYCLNNEIIFEEDTEIKLIITSSIPGLHVHDLSGYEIKGEACSISGTDDDYFEIGIEGIPYPFYQEEFPHHVKAYEKTLNKRH